MSDKDTIYRQDAIDAFCKECYDTDGEICNRDDVCGNVMILKALPSAQPEYYDYSDIDDIWKYYADEQDINLTDGAKQLKDAMWVGYRKGKQDAQPERTCVNCGRTANNGGWYADGRTRCPIEEHYALPKDGYCHLWEKRNVTDDDYPERREDERPES